MRKFQCENKQICDGDEYTTGYGFVGSKTRAALAAANVAPATAAQPAPTSEYTPEQQAQIAALKTQIVELTKVLVGLLAAQVH